jgi:hypothetical protein
VIFCQFVDESRQPTILVSRRGCLFQQPLLAIVPDALEIFLFRQIPIVRLADVDFLCVVPRFSGRQDLGDFRQSSIDYDLFQFLWIQFVVCASPLAGRRLAFWRLRIDNRPKTMDVRDAIGPKLGQLPRRNHIIFNFGCRVSFLACQILLFHIIESLIVLTLTDQLNKLSPYNFLQLVMPIPVGFGNKLLCWDFQPAVDIPINFFGFADSFCLQDLLLIIGFLVVGVRGNHVVLIFSDLSFERAHYVGFPRVRVLHSRYLVQVNP